jgi:hypothetical protein
VRIRRFLGFVAVLSLWGCSASQKSINSLRKSADPAVRAAAAEQLGTVALQGEQRDRAVAALADATLDPNENVRLKAIESLGKLGGPAARKVLVDVLRGREYQVAALKELVLTNRLEGEEPEAAAALAKAMADVADSVDDLKKAQRELESLEKLIETADPQTASRHYYDLEAGYQQLADKYARLGDPAAAVAASRKAATYQQKVAEAEKQGGGFGGFGGPGGINFAP